ncbi:MAG: hypothetical protein EXR64_04385 [Dehalococcoidia bacterium]|nr:hypothetical protein [Dehalococcoidia bacterium]
MPRCIAILVPGGRHGAEPSSEDRRVDRYAPSDASGLGEGDRLGVTRAASTAVTADEVPPPPPPPPPLAPPAPPGPPVPES